MLIVNFKKVLCAIFEIHSNQFLTKQTPAYCNDSTIISSRVLATKVSTVILVPLGRAVAALFLAM